MIKKQKVLNNNNAVCVCTFCNISALPPSSLCHSQTVLLLAATFWYPNLLLLKCFGTQQKAELRTLWGILPPDVKIYQQKQVVWQFLFFFYVQHTISITITSNNLQKFHSFEKKKGKVKHGRGSSFGAQPVWQRYMRENKSRIFGSRTVCVTL